MNDKKYLVLFNGRWGIHQYFINNVVMDNVSVQSMYRLYKKDIRYSIAALWMEKCKLPFSFLWYEKWKYEVQYYDVIIVSALNLSWNILSYIKKKNPNCRLIAWYWDTINEKNMLPKAYRELCEVWSFDEQDCRNYGLKKNEQFYWPLEIENGEINYDAIFVGRDKGRIRQLNEICSELTKNRLNVFTYIQRDKKENPYDEITKPIAYEDLIKLVAESRCIIDIPKDGQSGITMRVLEALFYSKKLITTDRNIIQQDFYNRKNIFIWGKDDVSDLTDFIRGEYQIVNRRIEEKYLFETWLKRFE